MTRYYVDLHTHSRHSRATSPECTLAGLYHWASLKGINVVGTGDCTHPAWQSELRDNLVALGNGLYELRKELRAPLEAELPAACRIPVSFIITGEVSCIYKRHGATRKVHNLLIFPSLESASRVNSRLAQIGNLLSDGRPTLKLDSRDLLEIVLECDPTAALIPAHIWTPWFSMLGAKSGFNSVEECFGDLSGHIFAVETGLSSDPPMNRRIRCLDRLALVSNSDLHSPSALGRNANLFYGQPSYNAIIDGLRVQDPLICGGTVNLYPEAGKYHADGHRACGVRLTPAESLAHNNLCPACGKPLTIGVLHRVLELERCQEKSAAPDAPSRTPFRYLIPLPELLAQKNNTSAKTKKVHRQHMQLLTGYGPELPLLLDVPEDALDQLGGLGAMIGRMRAGHVKRVSGFDGEYGIIHVEDQA